MKYLKALKIVNELNSVPSVEFDKTRQEGIVVILGKLGHLNGRTESLATYMSNLPLKSMLSDDDFLVWVYTTDINKYESNLCKVIDTVNGRKLYLLSILGEAKKKEFSIFLDDKKLETSDLARGGISSPFDVPLNPKLKFDTTNLTYLKGGFVY